MTTRKSTTAKPATRRTTAKRTTTKASTRTTAKRTTTKASTRKPAAKASTRKPAAKPATRGNEPGPNSKRGKAFTAINKLAKEINIRLAKASKLEGDAFDHRLAAAIRLGECKAQCQDAKINFKAWVEKHVEQSYETVRKLAACGQAKNPKLALEDLRARNAASMRQNRAKAAKAKARGQSPALTTSAGRTAPKSGFQAVETQALALNAKEQSAVAETLAGKQQKRLVSMDDSKLIADMKHDPAKACFKMFCDPTMTDHQRQKLFNDMCDMMGVRVISKAEAARKAATAKAKVDVKSPPAPKTARKPATRRTRTRKAS